MIFITFNLNKSEMVFIIFNLNSERERERESVLNNNFEI